ncbi:hypothetical protein GGD63_005096 [Bradyrhizobium sp. cir1]|nr:hypothetical protein [Bradyrhizobium sp. cir1]
MLLIAEPKSRSQSLDRSADPFGERAAMPKAYIIEVHDRTAGIIASDERGFRFFSSERLFDSLEGRQFRSARDAERAARAVLAERGYLVSI